MCGFGSGRVLVSSALAAALMLVPVSAQQAPEKIDYDGIYKIKDEGFALRR